MATDDLSRSGSDPKKRYDGVHMQQGRVLTDADFNEQECIAREDERVTRLHAVGPCGSPDAGLAILDPIAVDGIDFRILAGTFYLGGLRLTLDGEQTYQGQTDWLQRPDMPAPGSERQDLVYVQVWQQQVSAVEDDELHEVALGGADTATRVRTMFRVGLHPNVDTDECAAAWADLVADYESLTGCTISSEHELRSGATLTLDYSDDGDEDDPCATAVLGGYLGAENQAVRVQLLDRERFTWGLDNGAPLYRVWLEDAGSDRQTLVFITEPKDQAHRPRTGQVVELLPCTAVLDNGERLALETEPGELFTIESGFDSTYGRIVLAGAVSDHFGQDLLVGQNDEGSEDDYFFLRIWDRGSDLESAPELAVSAEPQTLGHTGLTVCFGGGDGLPGDHWIIAARPNTPDQVVPWSLEQGRGPDGYRRWYAPLAIIHWNPASSGAHRVHDCRARFRPLTDLAGCCTYTVGDGISSRGDYDSVEAAVAQLPGTGGRICLLEGSHRVSLSLLGRSNIHLTGCGRRTLVYPGEDRVEGPILRFRACQGVRIDELTLVSMTGTAILVEDADDDETASADILVAHNRIFARGDGVVVRVQNQLAGSNGIRILDNEIGIWDREDGGFGIRVAADDVLVEDNLVRVIPPPYSGGKGDPRDPADSGGPAFQECPQDDPYLQPRSMKGYVYLYMQYMTMAWLPSGYEYKAAGGIEVGGGSDGVRIKDNRVLGGAGNAITLGSLPDPLQVRVRKAWKYIGELSDTEQAAMDQRFKPVVYDVTIDGNRLEGMGLSGISVAAYFNPERTGRAISVEGLRIRDNEIIACAGQLLDSSGLGKSSRYTGLGGIALAVCEDVAITGNLIADNGRGQTRPVSGIHVLYGEKLDISGNRILNNGPGIEADVGALTPGTRGGIVIMSSFRHLASQLVGGKEIARPDGIPAVRVHDNIITQPMGHALLALALGPVSVVSNQLTSLAARPALDGYQTLAGAVLILDLGVSQDLVAYMLLSGLSGAAEHEASLETDKQIGLAQALGYLLLPSGTVQFSDNQTTLDLMDFGVQGLVSAQLIVTLDDLAYDNNQSSCRTLMDVLLTDACLLGATVRANGNRFQEGVTFTLNSLVSLGIANTTVVNQATHCVHAYGAPAWTQDAPNTVLIGAACTRLKKRYGRVLWGFMGGAFAAITP